MRNSPSILVRTTLFLAVTLSLSLGPRAYGRPDLQRSIANLRQAVERGGGKCYIRDFGNGKQRLYLNTGNPQAMRAVCEATGAGKNVLQICHINYPGLQHSLAAFDGGTPHFQTPDSFRTWRLNSWGPMYHSRSHNMYSAFIQLTPTESNRLKQIFAEARQAQGTTPQRTIPTDRPSLRWARGNCASLLTNLPVGDHGETLGQLVGIGSNGSPRGLQQALETRANERVFAIGVYGPALPSFGQNPNQNVVTFPR